jgi:DNA-binding CsgD family transcriptional regulator
VGGAIPWDAEIYPLLFAVAGVLIAVSLPRHPVGWLMLFVGACFAVNAAALQWLAAGNTSAAPGLAWWTERGSAALVPATLLLVLLVPDGRLPSDAWRPVVSLLVGLQLVAILVGSLVAGPVATSDPPAPGTAHLDNPFGVLPESWSGVIDVVIGPLLILPFLLGVAAVVQRFRRPAGDEWPRLVAVLLGVLAFALSVTVPDLLWPAASMWCHIAGVAAMTATIVTATVRGQFAPVRVVEPSALVGPTQELRLGTPPPDGRVLAALSPREREVMEYVARGLTNSEIARALFISPITVRNHVSSMLTKLEVSNRTQAVARFLGEQG